MIPTSDLNINWVPGITLDEMEKHCILQAFRFYRSNKTQTAQALGISIRTLDNKLEKYEADNDRAHESALADKRRRNEILARMRGVPQEFSGNVERQNSYEGLNEPPLGQSATTGVHVESIEKAVPKQVMPVSEREKVQTMLPRQAAPSGPRRHR